MKMVLLAILAVTVMIQGSCGASGIAAEPCSAADLTLLVDGNTGFALSLFGGLCTGNPGGNLFFSPYSISSALGMTFAGARGETEARMAEALFFDLPRSRLHGAFSRLRDTLDTDYRRSLTGGEGEPLTLEIANAIWVEATYPLLEEYVELLDESYGAEARNVDFVGNPEEQRQTINDWVSGKTRDRIRDLIGPGMISDQTRVVLTNAIYFKGSWMYEFNGNSTREGDFTTQGGTVIQVPMMHQTERFAYSRTNGCTAVSLPYSDMMSRMVILLPDGDLEEFEQSLDRESLEGILSESISERVALTMPSFEFSSTFDLGEALRDLGMTDAFDASLADFSGMTGNRDLFISTVVHKAFVKVDETGTEAAAATAVVMALGCAPSDPPVEVVLDRPFLFLVMDDLSGSILFMGRVADPSN